MPALASIPTAPAAADAAREGALGRLRELVEERHGIWIKDYLTHQLEQRAEERRGELGLPTVESYYHLLAAQGGRGEEMHRLVETLTNHETTFLRNPPQFEVLQRHLLPALRAGRREGRVRLASLGCSTGEEAYSLAMVALESFLPHDWPRVEVIGLDVSRRALGLARSARYADFQLRGVDFGRRARWFESDGEGHWRPRAELRDRVRFHQHNLVDALFLNNLDVVFCCNVLIYFRPPTVRRILEQIHFALSPGGYLFLGHSESALGHGDLFKPQSQQGAFFYQRPASRASSLTPVP